MTSKVSHAARPSRRVKRKPSASITKDMASLENQISELEQAIAKQEEELAANRDNLAFVGRLLCYTKTAAGAEKK